MKRTKRAGFPCRSSWIGLSMLLSVLTSGVSALPVHASDEASVVQYGDGVTVRKNPDGTVEVSDGGGDGSDYASAPPVPARQTASPRHAVSPVHTVFHPKTGSTRYSDGVVVKRNAGGSVEVGDSPCRMHKTAYCQARHARPKRTASRYADGVTVRHNSDGSVEVWDGPSYGAR